MIRSVREAARYTKKHTTYNTVLVDNPLSLQVPDITT